MKIIVDTREQAPLVFKHNSISGTLTETLNVGDYGVLFDDEYRLPIHFERKSMGDLYGTLSQGYDRFKKEMQRAKESNVQLIIIVENSLTRVLQGNAYSMRTPQSLIYQVFTIYARYGIQTVFCGSREESAEYITQFYIAHEKEHLDRKFKDINS